MNVTSVLTRLEPHQENWLSALCSQKGLRGIPRSHFTDGKQEAHSSWMTELAVAGLALESCVALPAPFWTSSTSQPHAATGLMLFFWKRSRLPSSCCWLARSLPQVAAPRQAAAWQLVHWPLHLQSEHIMWLRHQDGQCCFPQTHSCWIWFKQVSQRLKCLTAPSVCSHPQEPICSAILLGLLSLLMLWDFIFVLDVHHLTTETCTISDLRNYSLLSDKVFQLCFLILRWKA